MNVEGLVLSSTYSGRKLLWVHGAADLQTGRPFCFPTDCIKALKETKATDPRPGEDTH